MLNCVGSWICAFMLGTSFALEPSCPVCSKYEYEEKLLERVIRNELTLKDTLDKIAETQAKVSDTLKASDEKHVTLNTVMHALEAKKHELEDKIDSVIQNISESFQLLVSQTIKELVNKKQNLEDKVDAFIRSVVRNVSAVENQLNSTILALVGKTSKALDVIKEQSAIPVVMFHARLASVQTYTSGQDLVFQTILVNEGGGYDPNTGKFVASFSGVYMFTMQYCTQAEKWSRFDIVKEGTPLQRSVQNGIGGAGCVSMQGFAKVAMGEKVWVRCTFSTSEVSQSDAYWNSFAGMLINV